MLIQHKGKCFTEVNTQQMELKHNYIIVENISEIKNSTYKSKAHCFQEIH